MRAEVDVCVVHCICGETTQDKVRDDVGDGPCEAQDVVGLALIAARAARRVHYQQSARGACEDEVDKREDLVDGDDDDDDIPLDAEELDDEYLEKVETERQFEEHDAHDP